MNRRWPKKISRKKCNFFFFNYLWSRSHEMMELIVRYIHCTLVCIGKTRSNTNIIRKTKTTQNSSEKSSKKRMKNTFSVNYIRQNETTANTMNWNTYTISCSYLAFKLFRFDCVHDGLPKCVYFTIHNEAFFFPSAVLFDCLCTFTTFVIFKSIVDFVLFVWNFAGAFFDCRKDPIQCYNHLESIFVRSFILQN